MPQQFRSASAMCLKEVFTPLHPPGRQHPLYVLRIGQGGFGLPPVELNDAGYRLQPVSVVCRVFSLMPSCMASA